MTYTQASTTSQYSFSGNLIEDVADNSTTHNGQITNRFKIYRKGAFTINICAVIPLGYPCCFVSSITDTTTSASSFLINTASPSSPTSKTFQAGYYIDSAKTLNNDLFCYFGLSAAISCTTCTTTPTFTTSIAQTGLVTFTISTTDVANYGSQTLSLTFTDTRNTEQTSGYTQTFSFSFTCCTATLTVNIPNGSVSYAIKASSQSQTITFSESTSCGFTSECSLDSTKPAWVTNNGCTISWYTTDTSLSLTSYTVPITITYKSCPTQTIQRSFTITLTGCVGSFSVTTPLDQSYTVKDSSASLTISATDSSTCGYTYTCTKGSSAPSWVSVSTTCVVSWQTSDTTLAAGAYSVPVTVTFNTAVAQTGSTTTISFNINLSTCADSFTASTPTSPQTYVIRSAATSYSFTVTSQNNCGYTYSCAFGASSVQPTWLSLSSCTLTWSTSDNTLSSGPYSIVVDVTQAYQPSSITYQKTLSITLSPCVCNPSVTKPQNVIYTVKGASSSTSIVTSDSSGCGYSVSYALTSNQAWVTINSNTVSWQTDDLTLTAQDYTVSVSVTYSSLPTSTMLTTSFTISLSACVGSFIVSTPVDQSYTVKMPIASQIVTASESTCGYTSSCSLGLAAPSWVTLSGCTVSWSTSDITLTAQTYTVPVIVTFSSIPATAQTVSFGIILSSCSGFTVSTPSAQTYVIAGSSASQSITLSDTNSCGYSITCAVSSGVTDPSWISRTGCTIQWYTTDITLTTGSYTISTTVTVNTVPTTNYLRDFVITLSSSSCIESYSLVTAPTNQSYTLWSSAQSLTINAVDTSNCGYLPTCTLGNSSLSAPSWVSISGCVVSWYAADNTLNNSPSYLVPVSIKLGSTSRNTEFYINVAACNPSYTFVTPNNVSYKIVSTSASQTIGYQMTSTSACGYTPQCSFVSNPTWVTLTDCVVSWQSNNYSISTPSLFDIKLKLTYLDYNNRQFELATTSFYINVTENKDLCNNLTIVTNSITSVQLSYRNSTTLNLTPTDSVSTTFGQSNYCGNYSITFSNSTYSWLLATNNSFNLTLYQLAYTSSNVSITINYTLISYPAATASQQITILGQNCEVITFKASTNNLIVQYTIGGGNKSYSLPKYLSTPSCSSVYSYSLQMTQTSSVTIPSVNALISTTQIDLDVNDSSLIGQNLTFKVTASLNDPNLTNDSNFIIIVQLQGQTTTTVQSTSLNSTTNSSTSLTAQDIAFFKIQAANTPIFVDKLTYPTNIPCLNFQNATTWQFQTPIIFRDEAQVFFYSFDAPGIQKMFNVEYSQQTITLTLVTTANFQPFPGSYPATFQLWYQGSEPIKYLTVFFVNCPAQFSFGQLITRPRPKIKSVSTTGQVTISWNSTLLIPKNYKEIQNLTINYFGQTFAALQVNVVPGSKLTDLRQLNCSYYVTSFNNNTMELQVIFQSPVDISASSLAADNLKVVFYDQSLFISSDTNMAVEQAYQIEANIPRQLLSNQLNPNIQVVAQASQVAMLVSFAMPFILNAILSQILTSIRSLTLMVHLFTISLMYPANCLNFFSALFPLVLFDVFPTTTLMNMIFKFPLLQEDPPLTFQFNQVGYGSLFIVENMGSMFFIIFLYPVTVFTAYLISKMLQKAATNSKFVKTIESAAKQFYLGAFWRTPLRFCYESYLILIIMSFIQMNGPKFLHSELWSEIFCSYYAVGGAIFSVAFPFLVFIIYKTKLESTKPLPSPDSLHFEDVFRQYGTLDKTRIMKENFTEYHLEQFLKKFGSLVEGIDIRRIGVNGTIITPILDLMRRFLMALSLCFLYKQPICVLFILNYVSLAYICGQLHLMPFITKQNQLVEIFNELAVLLLVYHMYCFNDYVRIDSQTQVGNSLIYTVIGYAAFNLAGMLYNPLNKAHMHLKRFYLRCQKRIQSKAGTKPEQPKLEFDPTPISYQMKRRFVVEQDQIQQKPDEKFYEMKRRQRVNQNQSKSEILAPSADLLTTPLDVGPVRETNPLVNQTFNQIEGSEKMLEHFLEDIQPLQNQIPSQADQMLQELLNDITPGKGPVLKQSHVSQVPSNKKKKKGHLSRSMVEPSLASISEVDEESYIGETPKLGQNQAKSQSLLQF